MDGKFWNIFFSLGFALLIVTAHVAFLLFSVLILVVKKCRKFIKNRLNCYNVKKILNNF